MWWIRFTTAEIPLRERRRVVEQHKVADVHFDVSAMVLQEWANFPALALGRCKISKEGT